MTLPSKVFPFKKRTNLTSPKDYAITHDYLVNLITSNSAKLKKYIVISNIYYLKTNKNIVIHIKEHRLGDIFIDQINPINILILINKI